MTCLEIKIIIKFKFTFLEYCNEYLRYVEPKFIITFTDNNKLFYLLKSNTAKKIFIQCAWRTKINDVLGEYTDLINIRDELVGDAEQLKYLLSFK